MDRKTAKRLRMGMAIGIAAIALVWWFSDYLWPDPIVKSAWFAKYNQLLAESPQNPLLPFLATKAIFTGTTVDDVVLPQEDGVALNWKLSDVRTVVRQYAKPDKSVVVYYDKRDFEYNRLPRKGERWAVAAVQSKGHTWTLTSAYPLDRLATDPQRTVSIFQGHGQHALSPAAAAQLQQEVGRKLGLPTHTTLPLAEDVGLSCVLVPSGRFTIGASKGQGSFSDEIPVHEVVLTKAFYLGIHEVTQEQYGSLMAGNPSRFISPRKPVDSVTWEQAAKFCVLASRASGRVVRLPTEAEWEIACRAGSGGLYGLPAIVDDSRPQGHMRCVPKTKEGTAPVGSYPCNPWGLYDMHGNVMEWCSDWYWQDYYCYSTLQDPRGPPTGRFHSIRGGGWSDWMAVCTSSQRIFPVLRELDTTAIGFRVVVEIAQ